MFNKLVTTCLLILIFIAVTPGIAQDPHFSQFYANPTFLNPALTGSTECARFNLNYRNQWPSIPKAYVTYSASYDQVVPIISSGIGVSFMGDKSGDGAISRTHVSGFYSYKLKVSENTWMSVGFQGTFSQQKLDWNKLIFGDQIDPGSGNIGPTSETPPPNLDKSYVDFSAGAIVYYADKFFGGIAVHHLTQPDVVYYDNSSNKIPMKITFHGGTRINLSEGGFESYNEKDLILSPSILYQQQDKFKQLNIGAYINRYPFVGGLWIRNNFGNTDAAVILVGLQHENYKIGYSYDFSLSKLRNISGGAHEISFAYEFCIYKGESRRKIRAIKAPTF